MEKKKSLYPEKLRQKFVELGLLKDDQPIESLFGRHIVLVIAQSNPYLASEIDTNNVAVESFVSEICSGSDVSLVPDSEEGAKESSEDFDIISVLVKGIEFFKVKPEDPYSSERDFIIHLDFDEDSEVARSLIFYNNKLCLSFSCTTLLSKDGESVANVADSKDNYLESCSLYVEISSFQVV